MKRKKIQQTPQMAPQDPILTKDKTMQQQVFSNTLQFPDFAFEIIQILKILFLRLDKIIL